MAKIEIYESENDVKREGLKAARRDLKATAHRAEGLAALGLQNGLLFTGIGLGDIFADKMGITKTVREWNWVKKLNTFDPFPKASKWLDKNLRTINFSVGGAFLLLGIVGFWKARSVEKELEQLEPLGKGDKHVIIPDNLSTAALGQIPIGPVGEFELHKTPQEKIKSHTERLLQDVSAEPARNI